MHLDFEEYKPATPRIDAPISVREGVLVSIIVHLTLLVGVLLLSQLGREARLAAIQRAEERALLQRQQEQEARRFVFVQPLVDLEALRAPERSELSDRNRVARAPERAPVPQNPLPFSRGNSSERVEAPAMTERPDRSPAPPSQQAEDLVARAEEASGDVQPSRGESLRPFSTLPESVSGPRLTRDAGGSTAGESLGQALRNLQQYIDRESFDNPQGGGGGFGPSIQFDTKGVEFGPWIRRFVAQIKRNWIVPFAAMAMHGHVVMTFNVHKDGSITDLQVAQPSAVEGFNHAARNALVSSNPTYPLPPEYPSRSAFFTVTFYYNEAVPE